MPLWPPLQRAQIGGYDHSRRWGVPGVGGVHEGEGCGGVGGDDGEKLYYDSILVFGGVTDGAISGVSYRPRYFVFTVVAHNRTRTVYSATNEHTHTYVYMKR